jgi:hypothetical protein
MEETKTYAEQMLALKEENFEEYQVLLIEERKNLIS